MTNKPSDEDIMQLLLNDRRSDRRWRNIRFLGWMIILILFMILIFAPSSSDISARKKYKNYVALVRLNGVIMSNTSFSARHVLPELEAAFSDQNAKGVVLYINSPGGSPVQASIIHDRILMLKKQYKKKVIVVGTDTLASGAYLVSSAADKIYVNKDTVTGSIGVVMSGFGFTGLMHKVGVTRRLFTAGVNKHRLDPFQPLKPQDVAKFKRVLNDVHQSFINDVIEGRGDRLKGNRQELFSGDFWTGGRAVQLGIADGTANLWEAMQTEFQVKHFRDYTLRPSVLSTIFRQAQTVVNFHLLENNSPLLEQAF